MNALFNFLSSPLKQPAERPPPPAMPLTASKSKTYSPRERQRLNKRAMDRYTEPEGRSPRSRLSNVSSAPSAHDTTTGDISIVSRSRRSTITMAPPSEKKSKRASTTSAQSSPAVKLSAASVLRDVEELMASRRRSSRKEASPELGSSPPTTFDTPPAAAAASRSTPRSRLSQASRRASHSSSYVTATSAKTNGKQKEVENDEAQLEQREQEQEQQEQVADQDEVEQNGENEEEDDGKQHVFKRIMDHRWDGDKIQLRVEWQDGERTWTPEEIFHEDNLPALLTTSKGTSKVAAKKGTAKKVTKSRAKANATTKDPLTRTRGRSRVTKP
ncbi:Chromo domain-containing protein [Fusarium acuminatum]|uniref:Chromo domain-containing protein n=1 Tax=Fusarium acuminatum TaxID=5515 RepID=A0ABZ2X6L2_9HYPO